MKNKLENLVSFDDFKSNWSSETAKQTKRTQTGLDILKENSEEGVEEIIPEGPIDDTSPKYDMSESEKIEEITSFIVDADDDIVDAIVNELREVLLEMEQQGLVDEDTTDGLDDDFDGDWKSWIKAVIELPDFPEEGLNNVMELMESVNTGTFVFDDEDEDELDDDLETDYIADNDLEDDDL